MTTLKRLNAWKKHSEFLQLSVEAHLPAFSCSNLIQLAERTVLRVDSVLNPAILLRSSGG
jgi:hypothetical protein